MMNKYKKLYIACLAGMFGAAKTRKYQTEGYINIITIDFQWFYRISNKEMDEFEKHEKTELVIVATTKIGEILKKNNSTGFLCNKPITIQ